MHRVSGLRKETNKKKNKSKSTGLADALDTTESCLLESEERSYVLAEKH